MPGGLRRPPLWSQPASGAAGEGFGFCTAAPPPVLKTAILPVFVPRPRGPPQRSRVASAPLPAPPHADPNPSPPAPADPSFPIAAAAQSVSAGRGTGGRGSAELEGTFGAGRPSHFADEGTEAQFTTPLHRPIYTDEEIEALAEGKDSAMVTRRGQ